MKKGTLFCVKANWRINYFLAGVIFLARTTSHCSTQPIENTQPNEVKQLGKEDWLTVAIDCKINHLVCLNMVMIQSEPEVNLVAPRNQYTPS